mmetsp:Transcript_14791/g.19356  ORF Transcript_14791/g.19356 Transcript_14791/m.19356 type:complete len:338 (+) Transcript_14791:113-1126(+)
MTSPRSGWIFFALLLPFAAAFSPSHRSFQTQVPLGHNHREKSALTSSTSYLDSLKHSVPISEVNSGAAVVVNDAPPAVPAPVLETPVASAVPPPPTATAQPTTLHFHAPLDYFSLDNLASKGARTTADWGEPHEATRKLADDGSFRVGCWWCSEGGWPSPNPKGVTEIFYVLEGHGCLSDDDGEKHWFGPGDTVIIPKGHAGRWDVNQAIHKIWAVNDHARIEETSDPIRVEVIHNLEFAPQHLSANSGGVSFQTLYNVGPTKVGVWASQPGSYPVSAKPVKTFFHVLEGVLFVADGTTGAAHRCVPGDTVMMPAGWYGYIDVVESAKKLWTTADVE